MKYPQDYVKAIAEFEALDNDHKEPYLFAFIGYSIYLGQHFEKLLMNIIWAHKIVNRRNATNAELNAFFDRFELEKITMGALVWEVRRILNLSGKQTAKAESLLRQRNYIVHTYFKVNNNLLYEPSGYKTIIKDLLAFINEANDFEQEMERYLFQYIEKLGFTREHVQREIEEETEKWAKSLGDDSLQKISSSQIK
jgi:hypothetical protein